MEHRRLLIIGIYVTVVLAVVGMVMFMGAVAVQYFTTPIDLPELSPFVIFALGGLCLATLMFLIWFTIVGVLLARQTRAQGSGYGDAYRLIEAFRFREAIPLLERSIHEGKETSEVLMLLTSAYAYTGQLAKAQATADRAVQLFPDEPAAYVTLANGYRLQAAYEEAAQTLIEASKLDPDQPVIWAELGFTQQFAGNREAAQQSFEKAAQHAMPAPYGVRVYYHLANAYQTDGEVKKAVRATAKMMSARDGISTWEAGLKALEGTAYGQALRYEMSAIKQAIADADAGNLG